MPPELCCCSKCFASTTPSMPGTRTNVSNWHTASTPIVNRMRDFSSGILKQLANVLKMLRNMIQSRFRPARVRPSCAPRFFTPSERPLARPTARSAVSSTRAPSSNWFRSPTLTAMYCVVKRALLKPRFGMRRMSGIWPPSKPMRTELPERAVCPLPPRPEVFPWPLDSPWPSRFVRCFAPGRGLRLCSRIIKILSCGRNRLGRFRRFHFSNFQTAALVNRLAGAQAQQTFQRRLHHVRRVFRAERFGEDVLYPGRFQNGTDGLARDDSSSGRGRAQQHFCAAIARINFVRNCHVLQRNGNHLVAGDFAAAPDRVRDFAGLAKTDAHAAPLVAHDNERAEIKAASALHDFRGAVDIDNLLYQFFGRAAAKGIFRRVARRLATTATARAAMIAAFSFVDFSHSIFFGCGLKFQSGLARGVRQRLDLAVITVAAPVEDHFLDALVQRVLRRQRADFFCARDVRRQFLRLALADGRDRRERHARRVVNALDVDVFAGEARRHARALLRAGDFLAKAPAAELL